ncbi:MAG: molybdopterin-guanine dinucleotide biosynthesis protein B [Candidatus Heimdallarchaeota archaeon]
MLTRFIGITGLKKSGKTTTIETIVPKLAEKGLRVGTIKVAFKDVSIDVNQEHYDVIRHRNSKPKITMFKSNKETVVFYNDEMNLRDSLKILGKNLDIVLIEGFKENLKGLPQITLLKEEGQEKEFTSDYTVAISSIPELSIKSRHKLFVDFDNLADVAEKTALPLFPELNCKHCGYDTCDLLMKEVIAGKKAVEDCYILGYENSEVQLKVNDNVIPCNVFVQDIFKNVITGVLTTLKLEEMELTNVEINISYKSKKEKKNE